MNKESFDDEENFQKESYKQSRGQSFFSEVLKFTLIAIFVVLPIRFFIAEPFIVSGASMEPSFETGDYLIIDKISYRFHEPERGDVIVLKYPLDKSRFFIKRIVGLPGEAINIVNGEVFVIKDGVEEKINEPYVRATVIESLKLDLGEDEYFVMGDNRPVSLDSRSWGILKKELIKGKPFIRLLPITKIGTYPGLM